MSDYLLKCTKCKITNEVVYYCCSLDDLMCYQCSKQKGICKDCGKRKTNPQSNSRIRSSLNKQPNKFTCYGCKKSYEKIDNFVDFECKHTICLKCLSKSIQESIHSKSWQTQYEENSLKRQVKCKCGWPYKLDITDWLQEHCFCCGERCFTQNKVKLKFGLVIMQSCRNQILYDMRYGCCLTSQDILKLSKQCKSCDNLIDGYRRTIGIEDKNGYECKQCWGSQHRNIGKQIKDEQKDCVNCLERKSENAMICIEGFYLCKECQNHSKTQLERKENKKKSQEKPQKKADQSLKKSKIKMNEQPKSQIKKTVQCLICGCYMSNPQCGQTICSTCMRDNYDSPLVKEQQKLLKKDDSSIKKQQIIRYEDSDEQKNKSPLSKIKQQKMTYESQLQKPKRKKSNPDEKSDIKCISCDRNFKYQTFKSQSNFSGFLCQRCISQNEKGAFDFKRNMSEDVSNARIRDNKMETLYRSPEELRKWKQSISYKDFLKDSEENELSLRMSRPQNGKIEEPSWFLSEGKGRQIKQQNVVMESIIQEIPDLDCLQIADFKQNMMNCSRCGYAMVRHNMMSYKAITQQVHNLCIHCFMVCHAKKI